MGNWLSFPLLALAAALQATFIPQIRIFGGQPDLIFLLVISWAVHAPLQEALIWAFVGGILVDLLSAAPTGASTLGLVLLVFALDRLKQQLVGVGLILLFVFVAVGTLFHGVIYLGVIAAAGYVIRPIEMFTYNLLPSVAYNLVVMIPVYWFVRRVQHGIANPGRPYA